MQLFQAPDAVVIVNEMVHDTRVSDEPMFEYACHEGNYGLLNILRGARAAELTGGGSR